ncbi:DNA-processing protein DprA [Streptomyces sp. R11]|uniref:DNA-processing protein DprA n=1 Tax=Streptomyces sp. R11 TaxID=3238625 RepID=A0AB39N3M1_9ACTN
MTSDAQMKLLALCSIRIDSKSVDWSLIARAGLQGQLEPLCQGYIKETSPSAKRSLPILRQGLKQPLDSHFARIEEEIEMARKVGARLTTVLDDDYPTNLRNVSDLPPFIFYRGSLQREEDARSVAVVGTRDCSEIGISRTRRVARELGEAGFTITSGLARGVDTAAHTTALHFGRRTIAVIGTGITRCYPAENADLAEKIAQEGVVVSQFWPSRPPGRDTFPRRNHVTSAISLGSVVIEASRTSGAKMQARVASEQGRPVILLRSLVEQQEWARRMVEAGKAAMVDNTEQVVESLDRKTIQPAQRVTDQVLFDVE